MFEYFDNAHRSEKSPAGSAEYEYSKQRANGKPTTTNPQNLTYLINLILLPVRVVTVMVVLLSVKLNRTTTMHTICKHNALFSLCVSHGTGALLSTKTTTTHSDTRKCSTVCLPRMRLTCPCVCLHEQCFPYGKGICFLRIARAGMFPSDVASHSCIAVGPHRGQLRQAAPYFGGVVACGCVKWNVSCGKW